MKQQRWTRQYEAIALKQGWNLFAVGILNEKGEIQRYDESEIFKSDAEAICHVLENASKSKVCRLAIKLVYNI